MTDSIEEAAERLFTEDLDTWDMTGYYLYAKLLSSGVSGHIGTWGNEIEPYAYLRRLFAELPAATVEHYDWCVSSWRLSVRIPVEMRTG